MKHTELLSEILAKAEKVKIDYNGKELSAYHIAIAFAEFCSTEYTGFSVSDKTFFPNRYEEERLRLIYDKVLRNRSYFKLKLKKALKDGPEKLTPFDFGICEKFAVLRNNDILSSDLVLLCVFKELKQECNPIFRVEVNDDTIIPLLEYIDSNVYDYTIKSIEAVCKKLMEKSNVAAARGAISVAKFAEPEELRKQLFNNIFTNYENNVLNITIPKFLRGTDLKLSIYKVKDCYVIHDNGCAIKSLSLRIDSIKIQKVLDLIWGKSNLQDNKIFTEFTNVKDVLYFIQELILTANADLYYEYFKEETFGRRRYIEPCSFLENEQHAKEFDANKFISTLKDTVTTHYDETKGLLIRFDSKYCNCSYGIKVLIETLDNKTVRFSDAYKNKKYETGEMLEAFYFGSDNQEKDMYYEVIQKLAAPFGMAIDMTSSILFPEYGGYQHNHKNPYMLSNADNWLSDFYRFMNSAVLISVVADRINYEKIREW